MSDPERQNRASESEAFRAMAFDVLEQVLRDADDPGELSRRLGQQMRELTGARAVILLQAPRGSEEAGHRVVSVSPAQQREAAAAPELARLTELVRGQRRPVVWSRETPDDEAARLLDRLGFGLSIGLALNVGAADVGVLLLLGLPEKHSLSQILQLLDVLSTVVALVLRNSILFEESELRRTRLEDAKKYTESLIDSMLDTLVVLDPQARIRRVNPATAELLGYSEAELAGREVGSILLEEDGTPLGAARLAELLARGSVRDCRLDYLTRFGERVPVSFSGALIREGEDRASGIVGIARDIRELVRLVRQEQELASATKELEARRRSEEAIRALNAELARSNRELELFAYVASHDLQEPLRMVASYSELLARRYIGQLDARADRYIGYAVEGARRMQGLIDDLLALSRVSTQGEVGRPVPCGEVFAEVVQGLEKSVEESGAQFVCGELPTVVADRTQLGQVFQNLLSNAIKFRGEAPPRIEVSAQREGERWRFCVADNGLGIAPQNHDRIFVIFQRFCNRSTIPGSGIGLALVKKIVERHGGRVEVESDLGRGARFYFTLPAAGRSDEIGDTRLIS